MQYGTHAARPATPVTPTNCSPFYYETDTSTLFVWNGTSWVLVGGSGSGVIGLYGPVMSPITTAANTGLSTWVNRGGASATDSATGICLAAPSNGSAQNLRARTKATSGAHKYTALIALNTNQSNVNVYGGLVWSDGTKFQVFSIASNGSAQPTLYILNMANVTTQTATVFTSGTHQDIPMLLWLQTEIDASNLYYRTSIDGTNFVEVYSIALGSSYLGAQGNYTRIGIQIQPFDSLGNITLMSWTQT